MIFSPPMCGNGKFIHTRDEDENDWYTTCTQRPDHDGPHVGLISWEVGEESTEDEAPMTVDEVRERILSA